MKDRLSGSRDIIAPRRDELEKDAGGRIEKLGLDLQINYIKHISN
jgi:hypothetical protein